MTYLFSILGLILLCIWVWNDSKSWRSELSLVFWFGLVFKLLMGVLLGLIYLYYYDGADTWLYFQGALELSESFGLGDTGNLSPSLMDFLNRPRAMFFTRITAFLSMFGFKNYWITSIYFSIISFLFIAHFVRTIVFLFPRQKWSVIIAFFIFPSFVFWTSGIVKECLAVSGLLHFASTVLRLVQGKENESVTSVEWKDILLAAIGFLLSIKLKYYFVALFLPVFGSFVLIDKVFSNNSKRQIGFFVILMLCIYLILPQFLNWNLKYENFLNSIVLNYRTMISYSDPSNVVYFPTLEPTWSGILRSLPKAVFYGFFRPWPLDGGNFFKIYVGVENFFLLIGIILAVGGVRRITLDVVAIITFITISAGLLTIASPNLGSLARYKVVYLPFMVMLAVNGYRRLIYSETVD